jgi:hypothetical protein
MSKIVQNDAILACGTLNESATGDLRMGDRAPNLGIVEHGVIESDL